MKNNKVCCFPCRTSIICNLVALIDWLWYFVLWQTFDGFQGKNNWPTEHWPCHVLVLHKKPDLFYASNSLQINISPDTLFWPSQKFLTLPSTGKYHMLGGEAVVTYFKVLSDSIRDKTHDLLYLRQALTTSRSQKRISGTPTCQYL